MKVNSLDLILITGDIIDSNFTAIEKEVISTMRKLKATYGIFATTGIHEFYVGLDTFYQFTTASNITLLIN